jgi:hypothetical protein
MAWEFDPSKVILPIAKSVGAKHLGRDFGLFAKITRQMLRPYPSCRRSQKSCQPKISQFANKNIFPLQ